MRKLIFLMFFSSAYAIAQQTHSDFQAYRDSIINEYKGFRKGLLDDYAKFLDGIWKEFEVFRGVKRNDTPKPTVVPQYKELPDAPQPHLMPAPEPQPAPLQEPTAPTVTPPQPPRPLVLPKPDAAPALTFSFHGTKLKAPSIKAQAIAAREGSALADAWRGYQESDYKAVIAALQNAATALGLNEWFAVELYRAYADALLPGSQRDERIALQHFLLANAGFDVRVAYSKSELLLLIAFRQKMYERQFLKIDGTAYYIYQDNLSPAGDQIGSVYTCQLPADADKGRAVDLTFRSAALSLTGGTDCARTLTDGRLSVTCEVNTGMMELLRRYPQMDIPCYAASQVLPPLHRSVLAQLKPQIEGLSQKDAANALIHFVQYAFDYATDGEQHGYEKAYFLEENFYYPKNDCEDRAIFFAFLVRHLLRLDVHLVQFPGHECTAVHFTDPAVSGDGFMYKGTRFTICDPTYIGASIGRCMPQYVQSQPMVQEWY